MMFWLSLGVPVIVYPELSYLDWVVEWGYPLVAWKEDDVVMWLERCAGGHAAHGYGWWENPTPVA